MAAIPRINRAALDIFILLVLSTRQRPGFVSDPSRRSAVRCGRYCAGGYEEGKQNLWLNEEMFDLSVISD
jgi:hypothetical protein